MMKPQDVLVLLEIAVRPTDAPWRFKDLASDLSMSPSEIHAAIKRSTKAGLFDPLTKKPRLTALTEFLVHGLKYVFPAEPGTEVRGMPTAHSAPPLNDLTDGSLDGTSWRRPQDLPLLAHSADLTVCNSASISRRSSCASSRSSPHDDPRPVTSELLRLMSLPHSPALVSKAQACQMPQPNRAPIKGDAPSLHPAIKSSQSI